MVDLFWIAFLVIIFSSLFIYRTLTVTYGSQYEDNSIDAFIIQGDELSSVIKNTAKDRYKRDYITEGRQVLVLYGTEYGCSEEIAKLLYNRITDLNSNSELPPLQPRVINMKDYKIVNFSKEQACFIIISTSGDGVPPSDAKACYDFFLEDNINISHLKTAVLALGDSNYPQFCKTGRTLHHSIMTGTHQSQDNIPVSLDYIQHGDITEDKYSRTRPFLATLKDKYLLTVYNCLDDKETIHCEFDLTDSGLTWTAGDALGIYPENNPDEVKYILEAMKCGGSEPCDIPTWAYDTDYDHMKGSVCLRQILQKYYDLKHVKTELIQLLQESIHNDKEKCKLDQLLMPSTNKGSIQSYLQDREVIDVLLDFPSHNLSYKSILRCLKSLQPRYYSISSSPQVDKNIACVTAAVVRYKMASRNRIGVTTTYLQDRLTIGQKCPVFISRNLDFRLPSDPSVPLILIGPGTGIAPFMAFIQERALQRNSGHIVMYFGCRHKEKDFLYRSQLENWAKEEKITLHVAFSRDQPEKVYVQQLLYRDKQEIWQLVDKVTDESFCCLKMIWCFSKCDKPFFLYHNVFYSLYLIFSYKAQGLVF